MNNPFTRIALCLIAAANLAITMIGDLTPAQTWLSIGISVLVIAEAIVNWRTTK